MMMVQYLLDTDAEVTIPGVEAPVATFADVVAPVAAGPGPGEAGHRADQRPAADRPRGERLRLRAVHAVVHQGAGRGGRHHDRPARRGDPQQRRHRGHRGVRRPRAGRRGDRSDRPRVPAPEPCTGMPTPCSRVIVAGAGVIGLSCAVRLLAAGHRVDVLARDLPLETTSAVAAALWYPYRALPARPGPRLVADVVRRLRRGSPPTRRTSGVTMRDRCRGAARPQRATRGGAGAVPDLDRDLRRAATGTTSAGRSWRRWSRCRSTSTGWPGRASSRGGTITRMNLTAPPVGADVVVNCTGLGARFLAADPPVVPGAGAGGAASSRSGWSAGGSTAPGRRTSSRARTTSSSAGPTSRGSGAGRPSPEVAVGDPAPGAPAGARSWPEREGAPAPGRAAPGAARGAPGAGRRRGALLRPRRRRRHARWGCADEVVRAASARAEAASTVRPPRRVERPVDVREGLGGAGRGELLDPGDAEQVGVDHEQHERLGDVGVEALPHRLPLVRAAGVEEALLREGQAERGGRVGAGPLRPRPSRRPWRCGRSAQGSEQPVARVVEAAQGVVVHDRAGDAAVGGEHAGLGLDLLGGEDAADRPLARAAGRG